jgi:hypothetical protein
MSNQAPWGSRRGMRAMAALLAVGSVVLILMGALLTPKNPTAIGFGGALLALALIGGAIAARTGKL